MSGTDLVFPEELSYGSKAGPGFRTMVTDGDSGAEVRRSNWGATSSRARYDVSKSVQTRDEFAELLTFYRLHRGAAKTFRFWDPGDWSTAYTHDEMPDTNSVLSYSWAEEQSGGQVFHLRSAYLDDSSPGKTHYRRIYKPMRPEDSRYRMQVRLNGADFWANGVIFPGWSAILPTLRMAVDYDLGRLLFSLPLSGIFVTVAFTYHTPARFDQAADDWLSSQWNEADQFGAQIGIEEVAPYHFEGHGEWLFAGSQVVDNLSPGAASSTNNTYKMLHRHAYHLVFQNHPAGSAVWLPDILSQYPVSKPDGGPMHLIEVASGSNSIALNGHTGFNLATVAAGQCVEAHYDYGNDSWRLR